MCVIKRLAAPLGLLSLMLLMAPGPARADAIYTYTGNSFNGLQIQVSFETTLTGAQLFDLAPGTDISGTLVSFSLSSPPPAVDNGGFPVEVFNFLPPPSVVEIGTDGLGNITSWDISENLFASYPAVPGENPNDFFCTYAVSTTTNKDQVAVVTDHDAGLCRGPFQLVDQPGTWSPTVVQSDVPEPASYLLLGGGLLGILVSAARRKAKVS